MDPDVIVIGAGAAGIAAARELAALGLDCVVLEASARLGGRAFTESARLGAPFDHGASWLHQAGDNVLVPLARELGFNLVDHDAVRGDVTMIGDRRATEEEIAAYDAAFRRFDAAIAARAAQGGPDVTVAEAVPLRGPWDETVAHWNGPIISAAALEAMSLQDYAATTLGGPNLLAGQGLGELVRRLAEGLKVVTEAPVARLRWKRPDGRVTAEGSRGPVSARGCIVTVPTSVLAAGGIAFDPPLPAEVEEAVHALPLGLLTKVAFRAAGADRLDLPPFAGLDRRVLGPRDAAMTWVAWPFGHDHLIGFIGGPAAWELAREGEAATEAHARAELARSFGARRVATALRPEPALVTGWAASPWSRGSYSYARPGGAGARRVLAGAALGDGRLRFAGEACHPRFAGTVAGAWDTGREAARAVAAALLS